MVWNPHLTYTWTKTQLNEWVETYGHSSFHSGRLWKICSKRIAGSKFFKVWFEKEARNAD